MTETQQNETLAKELQRQFPPISKKPLFFEADLFKAVIKGKLDSVQYIIEKQGVDINQQSKEYDEKNSIYTDDTALHIAIKNNQKKIAEYLILKGANIEVKDGCSQKTPLHFACYYGHLKIVQHLIEKGANIEVKDEDQKTPLHVACENGHLPVVQYLIEKGADIEAEDFRSQTPLHYASSRRKNDVVKYLISKGANKIAKRRK